MNWTLIFRRRYLLRRREATGRRELLLSIHGRRARHRQQRRHDGRNGSPLGHGSDRGGQEAPRILPLPRSRPERAGQRVRRTILRQLFYALALTSPEVPEANPKIPRRPVSCPRPHVLRQGQARFLTRPAAASRKTKAVLFEEGAGSVPSTAPSPAGIPMPSSNGDGEAGELQPAGALGDDLDDLIG